MILSPLIRQRFFDNNGVMLAGGQLFSYVAGTTTPQVTYSNQGGTTNTNPVILDAYGYADVWIDPSKSYKLVLEDANNNLLWTVDNVNGTSPGGLLTVNTLPQNTTVLTGTTLLWPNLTIPNGLTLTVNSGGCFTAIHPFTIASGGVLQVNSGGTAYVF